jgi:DNA-binding NarL/FixJ family response regulator
MDKQEAELQARPPAVSEVKVTLARRWRPRPAGRRTPGRGRLLRLLAADKSNQQIADELVISLNTVLRHVSNIFAKTGAANRTEAAGYARHHALT